MSKSVYLCVREAYASPFVPGKRYVLSAGPRDNLITCRAKGAESELHADRQLTEALITAGVLKPSWEQK